jgi:hypothetical protein
MAEPEPRTLLLPIWLADSFNLARVIAEERRWSWTDGYRLLEKFELRTHERAFVKTLFERRTNLWLFRANQRLSCGDFIVVDMSAPAPADRRAYVIELKTGDPLALGGARLQCARHCEAIDEIAARDGIVDGATRVELVYGDPGLVLAHLGVVIP